MNRRNTGPAGQGPMRNDDGATLIGILVAVAISAVIAAMFTASLIMMHRSVTHSQAIASSLSEVNTALAKVGNQLRSAAHISHPNEIGDHWYVEWNSSDPAVDDCQQLRLGDGLLQQRTWDINGGQIENQTGWYTIAHNVHGAADAAPFERQNPGRGSHHQQLTVRLVVGTPTGQGIVAAAAEQTFAAVNTRIDTPFTRVCQETGRENL